MSKKERLKRDHAGIGPEPRRTGLKSLKGLKGYRIAKGEPDIRGWAVRTLNGREVGKVDDLLVDADSGEVVMMDVEMRASERHLQLPLRSAQLDHDAKRVVVDSGDVDTYSAVAEMPASERDRDDRYYDDQERARMRQQELARGAPSDDDLSEHDLRMREEEAARARARGSAVEREQLAPEMRADVDEVVVERRPVVEEVVIRRRVVDGE